MMALKEPSRQHVVKQSHDRAELCRTHVMRTSDVVKNQLYLFLLTDKARKSIIIDLYTIMA